MFICSSSTLYNNRINSTYKSLEHRKCLFISVHFFIHAISINACHAYGCAFKDRVFQHINISDHISFEPKQVCWTVRYIYFYHLVAFPFHLHCSHNHISYLDGEQNEIYLLMAQATISMPLHRHTHTHSTSSHITRKWIAHISSRRKRLLHSAFYFNSVSPFTCALWFLYFFFLLLAHRRFSQIYHWMVCVITLA